MKRLVLIAALTGALAACGDAAEESDEPVAEEAAQPAAVATPTSMAGTYEFELDGKMTTAVLNPDGTYTDTQEGQVVESGTWREMDDGMTCFDAAGEDTPEVCFTSTEPNAEGVFTATPDDGSEPLTIKKVS